MDIYSVSQITRFIKNRLEAEFPDVWVEGEISNLRTPVSGHIYFTLKDDSAQIQVVMFRSRANTIKFDLEDGLKVLVRGKVTVYEPRGNYQIIGQKIEPRGLGALQLAFEKLKQKLSEEGLFDKEKKKPIPELPQKIGIVTSPTGAAIRDILNILDRRFSGINILIAPSRVQGEEATAEIAEGIENLNKYSDIDLIIVTRGGGSLEDLWPFNEEIVARAIYRSKIPVISAVGHEIDFTISDFVADLRAPTPSAAAEIAVPTMEELKQKTGNAAKLLTRAFMSVFAELKKSAEILSSTLKILSPMERVRNFQQRIDEVLNRIESVIKDSISKKRILLREKHINLLKFHPHKLLAERKDKITVLTAKMTRIMEIKLLKASSKRKEVEGKLLLLSPYGQIERGYMIARKLPDMSLIKDVSDVKPGSGINLLAKGGEINATVEEILKNK